MAKVFKWFLIIFIVLPIGSCIGHRVLTKAVFNHWCENNIGLFVYEKVELGEEYFLPLPTNANELRDVDERFIFGDKQMLDIERFEGNYIYEYAKDIKVSLIGPIYSVETTIKRMSDSKLLGKAVSGVAYVSLFKALGSNKRARQYCPTGRDNQRTSLYYKEHDSLIRNIFTNKIVGANKGKTAGKIEKKQMGWVGNNKTER